MADSLQLFDMKPLHPGKILRQLMADKGWTHDELATITGMSRQSIYMILSGKSNISPETATRLAAAFANKPEEWLKWDAIFRLSVIEADVAPVSKMARLHDVAPIRDMQKRGWIGLATTPDELEAHLTKFFGQNPLTEDVRFPIAAKRTAILPNLNLSEQAWCFRARQLANALIVAPFSPDRLDQTERKLRALAAFPKEARHVPKVLSEFGIRFVVIEPLPGAKIDGAAFWLGSEPVIALTIQHDRIDGFWFTLMHEFAHIRNDDASVDTELIDGMKGIVVRLVEDDAERRANEQASSTLIPRAEMDSFVRRVGPFYARDRIVQFANKMKIHPGIIVGQLQHREEIGYSALREFLVKVRETVTSTAMTDGWNQTVAPNLL